MLTVEFVVVTIVLLWKHTKTEIYFTVSVFMLQGTKSQLVRIIANFTIYGIMIELANYVVRYMGY